MPVIIDGTSGITSPGGDTNVSTTSSGAATAAGFIPSGSTAPTNGVYLPAANAVGIATNSTNAIYIDSSQNIGLGKTNPAVKLDLNKATQCTIRTATSNVDTRLYSDDGTLAGIIGTYSNHPLLFVSNSTEKARITASGNVGINTSSPGGRFAVIGTTGQATADVRNEGSSDLYYTWGNTTGSAGTAVYVMPIRTGSSGTLQGGIYWNGSVLSLQGSSDYRLKENVAPLSNSLEKIAQLNPVSYTWKESGNQGKGFIAHELQAVIPDAVVGEKDAVDENGNIKPQSIDQTQIIVYLTKAIQELNAKVDAQAAEIAALKVGK